MIQPEIVDGFVVMHKDYPILEVWWDNTLKVYTKKIGENRSIHLRDYIYEGNVTFRELMDWLETRVPDKTRDDIDYILRNYGLSEFNVLAMCSKSYGRQPTNHMWLKFYGVEDVTYEEIRLRR